MLITPLAPNSFLVAAAAPLPPAVAAPAVSAAKPAPYVVADYENGPKNHSTNAAAIPPLELVNGKACEAFPGRPLGTITCVTEGSLGSDTIQIFNAQGALKATEPNGGSTTNSLLVNVGDKIRIPFSITLNDNEGCTAGSIGNANVNIFSPGLLPNVTITIVNRFGSRNLVYQDGIPGPFNAYDEAVPTDTFAGYMEFEVQGSYAQVDTNDTSGDITDDKLLINFQVVARFNCTAPAAKSIEGKVDVLGNPVFAPRQAPRRPRLNGFSLSKVTGDPVTGVEQNTVDVRFKVDNVLTTSTATYSVSRTPATPSTQVQFFHVVNNLVTSNPCPESFVRNSGDPVGSAECVARIGPLPQSVDTQQFTISATLTPTAGSQTTQSITYTVNVLHPRLQVTLTSDKAIYLPNESISYTLRVTNISGANGPALQDFSILSSLKGVVQPPTLPDGKLLAGEFFEVPYNYSLQGTEPNPLIDTVTVNARWVPQAPLTGSPVTLSELGTHAVQIESADLDLSFEQDPTPDYARTGSTITGQIRLKNTGTQAINGVTGYIQLANSINVAEVFVNAQIANLPTSIQPDPDPLDQNFPNIIILPFTINVPADVREDVNSLDLIVFVTGVSSRGVQVPRRISESLDVVRTNLRVKITSDASSNLVTRGQTVTYSVQLENVSTVAITGAKYVSESLGALPNPGGIAPVNLDPGQSTNPISFQFNVISSTANPIVELITATYDGVGTQQPKGQLVLNISDIQLSLTLTPSCQIEVLPPGIPSDTTKKCTDTEGVLVEPIVASTVNLGANGKVLRFNFNVTNVGPTPVTNLNACIGSATSCASNSIAYIALSSTSLPSVGNFASGEFGVYYASTTTSPLNQQVTLSVRDPFLNLVTFRTISTLIIAKPNEYFTLTKQALDPTTLQAREEFYLGEKITYKVRLCYDGPLSDAAKPARSVSAKDKFYHPTNNIPLTIEGIGGAAVDTIDSLAKGQCAIGQFDYLDDGVRLDTAEKITITNTVDFFQDQGTSGIPIDKITQSKVVTLLNPLLVTKTVNTDNVVHGDPVQFTYTFRNLGPLPLTELTAIDDVLGQTPFTGTPALPPTLNPGQQAQLQFNTFAPGVTAKDRSTQVGVSNRVDATAKVTPSGSTALNVKRNATATLKVRVPLSISKSTSSSDQFPLIFGPPITYNIVIKNESTTGASFRLGDAADSLNQVLETQVTANTVVSYIPLGTGSPQSKRLNEVEMNPTDEVRFSYRLSPADAPQNCDGDATCNTITVDAKLSKSNGVAVPAIPDLTKSVVSDEWLIDTILPLQGSICFEPVSEYAHWGETLKWKVSLTNITDEFPGQNKAVILTSITTNVPKTGTKDLILDFGARLRITAGQTVTREFNDTIDWKDTRTSFDYVVLNYTYEVEGVTVNNNPLSVIALRIGCQGATVGPPLKVEKKVDKPSAVVGDLVTYDIKISNPTRATTINTIVATDLLADSSGAALPLVYSQGATPGTLLPGQFATYQYQYTLKATDPIPLNNTVEVNGKYLLPGASTPQNFPETLKATATVTLPPPDLTLDLFPDKPDAQPGELVTVRVKATNNGQVNLFPREASIDKVPETGFEPQTGINAWIVKKGGDDLAFLGTTENTKADFLEGENPSNSPTIGLFKVRIPANATTTEPYTLKVSVKYLVTGSTTLREATANLSINVLNPNLRVSISVNPSVFANYGQSVEYTIKVENPSQQGIGTAVTDLAITSQPSGFKLAPSDILGPWKLPNGSVIGDTAPTVLEPGVFITRTLQHLITEDDNSPLTFKVTAAGKKDVGGTILDVSDSRTISIVISGAQLLVQLRSDKTQMTKGEENTITASVINIGSLAIRELTMTAIFEDKDGVQYTAFADGSVVCKAQINPPVNNCTIIPEIPGNNPNSPVILQPLGTAIATLKFKLPDPLGGNFPNPLVVNFRATGKTSDGISFNAIETRVPIKIVQFGISVSETPNIAAAAVNSTVAYTLRVSNTSQENLNITEAKDNITGLPVLLVFPGSSTPSATGTLAPAESATGVSNVLITPDFSNPFLHSMTVKGNGATLGDVQDTSTSQITIIPAILGVDYRTSVVTATPNQQVDFSLEITNNGAENATSISAKDKDRNIAILLFKDSLLTDPYSPSEQLAPNAKLYGKNTVVAPGSVGTFVSTAEVTGQAVSGQPFTVQDIANVEVVGVSLIYTRRPTAVPNAAAPGAQVEFQFTVKNTGSPGSSTDTLSNLQVTCPGRPQADCPVDAGFNGTQLIGGQEKPGVIRYTVKPTDTGTVSMNVQVSGTTQTGDTKTVLDTGTFNVVVGGLSMTKTANRATAAPGNTITYTIRLENTGNGVITFTQLSDTLEGDVLSLIPTAPTLSAQQVKIFTYDHVVPAGTPTGTLTNTITANFDSGGAKTATASASVSIQPGTGTDTLTVTVTPSQANAKAGDVITYTTKVKAPDGVAVTNLSAISTLGSLNMNITGSLTAGEEKTFVSANFTVPSGVTGPYPNQVTVTGKKPDNSNISGTGTGTVQIIGPGGLTVSKVASKTTASVGDVITYTVTITNNGQADLTLTTITDSLVSPLNPGFPLPSPLAIGASRTFNYTRTVLATDPASLTNTITVTANDVTSTTYTQTSSVTVTVVTGTTGLTITANTSTAAFEDGVGINYAVTVTNTGAVALTGIVAEYAEPGTTFFPALNKGGIAPKALQTITLNKTSLAPGEQAIGTFTFTPSVTTPSPLSLALRAQGKDASQNTITGNGSTASIPRKSATGLTAQLTADRATVAVLGDKIKYTLSLTNTSSAAITTIASAVNTSATNLAGTIPSPVFANVSSLAAGGNTTLTFDYTVVAADLMKTSLTFGINLTSSVPAQTLNAPSISIVTALVINSFTTTCTPLPCVRRAGEAIPLSVSLTNNGSTPINFLKFVLNTTPAFTFTPLSTERTIPAGSTVTRTFSYTVPATAPTPNPFQLSVTALATMGSDENSLELDPTKTGPQYKFSAPSLSVTPVTPPAIVPDLSTQTVAFTVTNTSSSGDTLYLKAAPDLVKFAKRGASTSLTQLTNTITYSKDTLAVGESATVSISYTILAADPDPLIFQVSVSACVVATGCDSTSTEKTPISPQTAELTLDLDRLGPGPLTLVSYTTTCPGSCLRKPGELVQVAVTVRNTSTTDTVTGITIKSAAPGFSYTAPTPDQTIPPNTSITYSINYTVLPTAPVPNPYELVLSIEGVKQGTTTKYLLTARSVFFSWIDPSAAKVTFAKTANLTTAKIGEKITYTLLVSNQDSIPITITKIEDTLVTGITFSTTTVQPGNTVTTSYDLTVDADDPAILENTATLSYTSGTSTTVATVTSKATVYIDKTGTQLLITASTNATAYDVGAPVTYTVTVVNAGSTEISEIAATYDDSPVTNVATSPKATQTIALGKTTLKAGESTTGTFIFATNANTPNPLVIKLAVSGKETSTGKTITVNSQTSALARRGPGGLTALLTTSRPTVSAQGDTINYTLRVSNTGAAPIKLSAIIVDGTVNNLGGSTSGAFSDIATKEIAPGTATESIWQYTVQSSDLTKGTLKFGVNIISSVTPSDNPLKVTAPSVSVVGLSVTPKSDNVTGDQSDNNNSLGIKFIVKNTGGVNLNFNVSGAKVQGTVNGSTSNVTTSSIGTLTPGQESEVTVTFTLTTSSPDPTTYGLNVTGCPDIGCLSAQGVSASASGSSSYSVSLQRARLSVSSSITPTTNLVAGTSVQSNFTLSNNGFYDLVNVTAGTAQLFRTNGEYVKDIGTPTLTIASTGTNTITKGSSMGATFVYVVQSSDPSSFYIKATFTGRSQSSTGALVTGTTNTATVSLFVPTATPVGTVTAVGTTTGATTTCTTGSATNGLTIRKCTTSSNVSNGSAVVYTITVTNTSSVAVANVIVTDSLPTQLRAGTVSSSVGTASTSGTTITANLGTLAGGQTATITLNTTVSGASGGSSIVNQACMTSATSTTSTCSSATISTVSGATTLPTTGMGGFSGIIEFGLFVLTTLFIVAMVAGANRGGKGGGPTPTQIGLIVGGLVVGVIAVALIFSIITSANRRGTVVQNATVTAIAALPTQVIVTKPPITLTPRPSLTPAPTLPFVPTFTPFPTRTPLPTVTRMFTVTPTVVVTATALPRLFEPVGERSLYIPKLNLPNAVPIVLLPLKGPTWDVSNLGQNIGHLEQTNWLGKTGNTVLAAHIQLNFREMGPFKDLNKLQVGDKVMLADKGKFYVYEVTGSRTVDPTAVEVTYPTNDPTLTLLTCTVWDAHRGMFAKRLVVTAKLVQSPPDVS
jgi:LPXTG-site transpeptidase (sortase) family protein